MKHDCIYQFTTRSCLWTFSLSSVLTPSCLLGASWGLFSDSCATASGVNQPCHPAVHMDIWSLKAFYLLPWAHFVLCQLSTKQLVTYLSCHAWTFMFGFRRGDLNYSGLNNSRQLYFRTSCSPAIWLQKKTIMLWVEIIYEQKSEILSSMQRLLRGQSNSLIGKAFALHMINSDLILSTS